MLVTIDMDFFEHDMSGKRVEKKSDFEILKCLYRLIHVCTVTKCKICLAGHGLHIYVYVNSVNGNRYDFSKVEGLRAYLCDDVDRLYVDFLRWIKKNVMFVETLFRAKHTDTYSYQEKCVEANRFLLFLVHNL